MYQMNKLEYFFVIAFFLILNYSQLVSTLGYHQVKSFCEGFLKNLFATKETTQFLMLLLF